MGHYKTVVITAIVTVMITGILNYLLQATSSFFEDAPTVEITSNEIPLPIALPLSIISKEEAKEASLLIEEFEKEEKPDSNYKFYAIDSIKKFLQTREDIANSPSEKIVDSFRRYGSYEYTYIKVSNETDIMLTNISVIASPNDLILGTNASERKNYKLDIEGNQAHIESLAPGDSVTLFTNARMYSFIRNIRVLYNSELIEPTSYEVSPNSPLGLLVSTSNSSFLYGYIIFLIFLAGTISLFAFFIVLTMQLFSKDTKESETEDASANKS